MHGLFFIFAPFDSKKCHPDTKPHANNRKPNNAHKTTPLFFKLKKKSNTYLNLKYPYLQF